MNLSKKHLETKFRNWCKKNFLTGGNKITYTCPTKEDYLELRDTLSEYHEISSYTHNSTTYKIMCGEVKVTYEGTN